MNARLSNLKSHFLHFIIPCRLGLHIHTCILYDNVQSIQSNRTQAQNRVSQITIRVSQHLSGRFSTENEH